MYEYVVEYLQQYRDTAQRSTAQSPLHKAASQVRADRVRIKRCTYIHAFGVRVFQEHVALGICKSSVCTQNVGPSTASVIPFHSSL